MDDRNPRQYGGRRHDSSSHPHQRPRYDNGNRSYTPHRPSHLSNSRGFGGTHRHPPEAQVGLSVPTNKVTPHAATQPNLAQHAAIVVRTGVTHTQELNGGRGTVQFYSSVQRKGGAFTDSEAATLRQLGPQRNMQRLRGNSGGDHRRGEGDDARKERVAVTSAGRLTQQTVAAVERRFSEAEERRRGEDFALARRQEAQRKRTRFHLDSSDTESGGDDPD